MERHSPSSSALGAQEIGSPGALGTHKIDMSSERDGQHNSLPGVARLRPHHALEKRPLSAAHSLCTAPFVAWVSHEPFQDLDDGL